MSDWDYSQLQTLWQFAGGTPSRAPLMAAIALAESSGDSNAVSPAGAISLWQVMPFWAGELGMTVADLFVPLDNARAARSISGGGFHVGAWDTCYNPPESAADRKDLTWPETGSPAWNILHDNGGGSSGGGSTAPYGGATPADRQLLSQFAQANYYNAQTIPWNTQQVVYNTGLRPGGPPPVIL